MTGEMEPQVEGVRDAGDPFAELILGALPKAARDARLLDVRVGPFWTVVHTSAGAGMASTMSRETHPHSTFPIADAGRLHERTPLELSELLRSTSVAEAAVGMAAVNSLTVPAKGVVREGNAEAIIGERGAGKKVAVIGRFPFVERLRSRCQEVWVFERGRSRRPDDLSVGDMAELLPRVDVVAVTATTLINHTLSTILPLLRPDAFRVILGPSTPMVPALIDRGFDVLCGSVVEDPAAVLLNASQGAVTRQIQGVRRVSLWASPSDMTG